MNEPNPNRAFLGRGWKFPPEFSKDTREVELVSEEEDIRESLHILLSTVPGERTMNPAYGCELKTMVFDSIDENSEAEIADVVKRAILFFEPRIDIEAIRVDITDAYDGMVHILLDYTVRTTNTRRNMVYPFYYREGTNLPA